MRLLLGEVFWLCLGRILLLHLLVLVRSLMRGAVSQLSELQRPKPTVFPTDASLLECAVGAVPHPLSH